MLSASLALTATVAAQTYAVNFGLDTKIEGARALNGLVLTSPGIGTQSVAVGQKSDRLLYHDLSENCFVALRGETVTASFSWEGNWMHGYVYLDRDADGEFAHELGEKSAIPEGSDVMTFSNYNEYNSAGTYTANGNVGVNPPAFRIPADLAPGVYRMRYKVDWNSIDPGGNISESQLIWKNGGAITDVSLYVVDGERTVEVVADHGAVTLADGSAIDAASVEPGRQVKILLKPDEGYIASQLTIESGFSIEAPEGYTMLASGERRTLTVPGILLDDAGYTISAEMNAGPLKITATFVPSDGQPSEGNYESPYTGSKDPAAGITGLRVGNDELSVEASTAALFADKLLRVQAGKPFAVSAAYSGTAQKLSFYVDINNNGVYSAAIGECLATASADGQFGDVTMPEGVRAGIYRARVEAAGHCTVDFLLNVYDAECALDADVINGLVLGADLRPMPNGVAAGTAYKFHVQPALEGFEPAGLTIRAGYRLDGPQYVRGNRQWEEIELGADATAEIPASMTYGTAMVVGAYDETPESEWTAIWSDEFDSTTLDTDKWSYEPRAGSTWNKRIAVGDEIPYVNKFDGSHYNSYAIATPAEFAATETKDMITGAIYSASQFYCRGGRIEARLRTRGHAGNFPAFWMMPHDGSAGWPNCGEIDIWEQIDNGWTTFHTVHTAWTNRTLGSVAKSSPAKSGSTQADPALWHVYTLEWDADEYLKWYVDGKLVFTYSNQHYSSGAYTEAMTWPFGKAFYVILNQSVGDGSWAAAADPDFEYLTQFDYVRVYQRKDALDYYSKATGKVSAVESIGPDVIQPADGPARYYNLQGIAVSPEALQPGIYIERRGARSRKIVVR